MWNQRCTLHIIRMENTLNTTHISCIFEYISTYSHNRSTEVRARFFFLTSFVLFFFSLSISFFDGYMRGFFVQLCSQPNELNRTSNQESDTTKIKATIPKKKKIFGEIFSTHVLPRICVHSSFFLNVYFCHNRLQFFLYLLVYGKQAGKQISKKHKIG